MRNKATRAVFDYWADIKADRAAPLRTEIDPVALRNWLPHLFIATADAAGLLTFRLAGTRVCDLFDRELRGAAFAETWLHDQYAHPAEIVHNVIGYERPALLDVLATNGDVSLPYEMLLLPVRSEEEEKSDRVLGALLPHGSPFPATERPVIGLALANWTFLVASGLPVETPPRRAPRRSSETLWRRLFAHHQEP
ncbi:PAS domain-containing protein [Rhizobium puerariae]|uniref:PAS domain-containing protein n=1 Tax=Rhizobium puerariae TaxID=1585791 RepID=A0ABV6AJJ5_9HYPH